MNTLALSVVERRREIGMLRAVGMQRKQVRRTIYLESLLIAVFGAVLGLAIGLSYGSLFTHALHGAGLDVAERALGAERRVPGPVRDRRRPRGAVAGRPGGTDQAAGGDHRRLTTRVPASAARSRPTGAGMGGTTRVRVSNKLSVSVGGPAQVRLTVGA